MPPELPSADKPCACGCGETVRIGRFASGHQRRMLPRNIGYLQRYNGGDNRNLHRLRAEKALGRPLPPTAQVHHVDGDVTNPNARLVICDSASYHMLLHARARVLKAGGNPNTDKICSRCREVKPAREFYVGSHRCKPCAITHSLVMKRGRRANAAS